MKTIRISAGFTQAELAKRVGTSRNNIASYESGQYLPQLERAVALARALNVSLKELARAMNIDVEGVPNDDK